MTVRLIVAALLYVAVLLGWARLILWQRRAKEAASWPWRLAVLLLAQPVVAGLLFLGLFPPLVPVVGGTLTVATAGTSPGAASAGRLVILPEAPMVAGGVAVPDLATALRRHADTTQIVVLGEGLTARDRDAVAGRALRFDPPVNTRAGLTAIVPPVRVAPGAGFVVAGQVANVARAQVELIDPAGRVTDSAAVDKDGSFQLSGTSRAAGAVSFAVQLRDARGKPVERAEVPVWVADDAAPRLLILAGAPGPEVKYLRRWASDAGFAVTTQMSAGGGIALGDAPMAIDGASLRGFDAVIADDRAWAALGSRRGVVLDAVRDGLGLILRAGGPLDGATRAQWRALGFGLSGGDGVAPIALPLAANAALARTRRGIGRADGVSDEGDAGELLPDVSRVDAVPGGDSVPLIRDVSGTVLSAWRASGNGRIALWTGIDSFGLILTGRQGVYGDWWGGMLAAIARPVAGAVPGFDGMAWVGERVSLCGLTGDAQVRLPGGAMRTVRIDPAARGCGAFWPGQAGWHLLKGKEGRDWPFYVQAADALPAVRMAQMRHATLMLRGESDGEIRGEGRGRPGSSWPFLAAWLVLSALLWWFERSRLGRPGAALPGLSGQ